MTTQIETTTTTPPTTRAELRTHWRRIQQMITKERRNREMFNIGGRAEKLVECDDALASLETLGNWIRDLLPPEPEQAALIEISQRKGY